MWKSLLYYIPYVCVSFSRVSSSYTNHSQRMDSWNPLSSTSARRSASFRDVANPSKTSLYHEQTYGAPSTTSMRPKISPEQALEIEEAFYLFDIQRTGM